MPVLAVDRTGAPRAAGRPAGTSLKHVPALDGLRGIAVMLVVLCHAALIKQGPVADRAVGAAMRLGWSGVDLFFVLSGFLITGILLASKGQPNYLRNFYARRTVRIFPLYYAVLAFTFFILPLFPRGFSELFGTVQDQSLYWLYLSNFAKFLHNGWEHSILSVTWSLAIEEQFYLVWPLIVLLCSRRTLVAIAVAAIITSVAMRGVMSSANVDHIMIYAITFCRLDGLSVGALVALITFNNPRGTEIFSRWAWPIAGLMLLGIGFNMYWHKSAQWIHGPGQTFGYTIFAILYACVLIKGYLAKPGSMLHWSLTQRPLLLLGKYSYAIYLFHLPVQVVVANYIYGPEQFHSFGGSFLPGQLLFVLISFPPCLLLAWLSWNLLEKPCLSLKRFFPMDSIPAKADQLPPSTAPSPAPMAKVA
jgi:peptidoglycan/LPS O-acetylase OafA/YrhL